MKKSITAIFLILTLSFGLFLPQESSAASGLFSGSITSFFRNMQTRVQGFHVKITRFFGSRRGDENIMPPSIRLTSPSFGDEWIIGSDGELQWEYSNLRKGVTKVNLVPKGREGALLVVLPARRNTASSDNYEVPVRYEPGVYQFQVCNDDFCQMSEEVSFVFVPSSEQEAHALGPSDASITLQQWVLYSSSESALAASSAFGILEEYGDEVRMIVKFLPSSLFSPSDLLAEAVLCASDQGEEYFLETHRRSSLGEWSLSDLRSFLSSFDEFELELFDTCMERDEKRNVLKDSYSEADREGIEGVSLVFLGVEGERMVFSKDELSLGVHEMVSSLLLSLESSEPEPEEEESPLE